MARFDDLCADFQRRKPRGPITAEVPWFNVPLELQKGSESVNDVLRKYLKGFNLEYLNEGENCILYPQGNLAEAKAAIERILTDAELRKKLDTGAEETVKERNWKRIEPQILEQYLGK